MSDINIWTHLRAIGQDIYGEYRDEPTEPGDPKLTPAEGVEVLGQALLRLAEEPALSAWSGPLSLIGKEAVDLAIKMGEDGL